MTTPVVHPDPGDGYGPYVEIALTQGYVARVSPEDYEEIDRFRWRVHVRTHRLGRVDLRATRYRPAAEVGKKTSEFMHRHLLPGAQVVDHRNGDSLDNRRPNLRAVSYSESSANTRRRGSSRFNGVCWNRNRRKWYAVIKVPNFDLPDGRRGNGTQVFLGSFASEVDAALAYDAAALLVRGDVPRLNVPDVDIRPPLSDRAMARLQAAMVRRAA